MADFLYRIRPSRLAMLTEGPTPDEAQATQDHFAYLSHGVDEGRVLLAGRTATADPETFGIVIFRAADQGAAQAFVDDDPAVKAGVMKAELFPYRLALLAPRWDKDEVPRPALVAPPSLVEPPNDG